MPGTYSIKCFLLISKIIAKLTQIIDCQGKKIEMWMFKLKFLVLQSWAEQFHRPEGKQEGSGGG